MSNSLLAAALSAITENTVITYDDYIEKKIGDSVIYNELDKKSLHQSHLVGGKVPTSSLKEPKVPKLIEYNSIINSYHQVFTPINRLNSLEGYQIFVKTLTGKTITLYV